MLFLQLLVITDSLPGCERKDPSEALEQIDLPLKHDTYVDGPVNGESYYTGCPR